MRFTEIPSTAGEHLEQLRAAVTDEALASHPFYEAMVAHVAHDRSPLLYEMTDPVAERTNFSNWFHLIARRDYAEPALEALYVLHEIAHLVTPVPQAPASAWALADAMVVSEDLASSETEVLVHQRVEGLRSRVLVGRRILVDILGERGMSPDAATMLALRPELHSRPGGFLAGELEVAAFYEEFDTRPWALRYHAALAAYFEAPVNALPATELDVTTYEEFLTTAPLPRLDEDRFRANVLLNAQRAFALLGRRDAPRDFVDVVHALRDLDGTFAPMQQQAEAG